MPKLYFQTFSIVFQLKLITFRPLKYFKISKTLFVNSSSWTKDLQRCYLISFRNENNPDGKNREFFCPQKNSSAYSTAPIVRIKLGKQITNELLQNRLTKKSAEDNFVIELRTWSVKLALNNVRIVGSCSSFPFNVTSVRFLSTTVSTYH